MWEQGLQQGCKRCGSGYGTAARSARTRRTFFIPGAERQYAPDLAVKIEHVRLEIAIDPKGKRVEGSVTHRVSMLDPSAGRLTLDQVGIRVRGARIGGSSVPFETEGDKVHVGLPEGKSRPAAGESFEFTLDYEVSNPRRGLWFTGPDEHYPDKPWQVWSQGQDEDNRYWFPTFDFPNQKATCEMIATVPAGWTAVSNGALLSKTDTKAGARFHYKLGSPLATYLITLVVGKFALWEEKGPGGLPVQFFVAEGREKDGKRAFGNTVKMIQAISDYLGVPYAYEKYAQVAVQDFIFGGMENTSATTQTDRVLHDERAALDFSGDPLVSHELAHQWFGDLLTCRDWSHGWLNEGFATFFERIWVERKEGPDGGPEEAKYYSYKDLQAYLEEDSERYRRPIVCNTYLKPSDVFDTHLYQKGGLVLNLLRHLLGEPMFRKALNLYVTRHRNQNVETSDLIRAIEDATGRNMRRFFDEWIFGAGHPEFEVTYQWHDDRKLAELVIEQKQTGGQHSRTENGATTHVFRLPVTIELTLEGGAKASFRVELREARERVFLHATSKPTIVRFDPGFNIPKTLKFKRPKELLIRQLEQDDDCMGRIEAARELCEIGEEDCLRAVGRAAAGDRFWGVQAEAAKALAKVPSELSRDLLIAALGARNPKARKEIVSALGSFRDAKAADYLQPLALKDESYFVEAAAVAAWAAARSEPDPAGVVRDPKRGRESAMFLVNQLAKPSFRDMIRKAAFQGMSSLPGIGRGEHASAIQALIEWSRRGKPTDARMGAILALGRVASFAVPAERAAIIDVLDRLADEEDHFIRHALVGALIGAGVEEGIPVLRKIARLDSDGRIRRDARTAADAIGEQGGLPEVVNRLREDLERLEKEHAKLRGWIEDRKGAGA